MSKNEQSEKRTEFRGTVNDPSLPEGLTLRYKATVSTDTEADKKETAVERIMRKMEEEGI